MEILKMILRKITYTINKLVPLPTSIFRLSWSIFYQKDQFANQDLQTDSNIFNEIYSKNYWNSQESRSGGGSTLNATQTIREYLEYLFIEKEVKTMLDIPCGDYNWMNKVRKYDLKYIGADIVPVLIKKNEELYHSNNVSFMVKDLTKDSLPTVDLIFCKDCLQHLSYLKVKKAINNIKKSNSKYLLVTTYPKTWRNWDILDGDYRPLNLRKSPFNFPKPELKILEKSEEEGVEVDKTMYFYKISDLPFYSDL